MLRDFSLRDFGASLNTVESYTNESSQGKIGLCETANKQKRTHLGMFLASEKKTSKQVVYYNNEATKAIISLYLNQHINRHKTRLDFLFVSEGGTKTRDTIRNIEAEDLYGFQI